MTRAATAASTRPAMSMPQWGMLLLLGGIWGGSFFFAHIALTEISPLMLVTLRVSIAAVALQLWLRLYGPSFALALPYCRSFLLLGVINNIIPYSLIFAGQTQIGAGIASVLNATTTFWTAIVAGIVTTDERLSATKILGIALGVAGTAVMIGVNAGDALAGPVWAKLALIGAALSYALAFIFARRFKSLPAPVVATGQLSASTVLMVPLVFPLQGTQELFMAGSGVWSAVIALALLSTAFAYILYFRLVAEAGATNASLVTLIVPASAILLGAAFLGEALGRAEIAGIALIACGLVSIDGRVFNLLGGRR